MDVENLASNLQATQYPNITKEFDSEARRNFELISLLRNRIDYSMRAMWILGLPANHFHMVSISVQEVVRSWALAKSKHIHGKQAMGGSNFRRQMRQHRVHPERWRR